jgi:hypothetical protein
MRVEPIVLPLLPSEYRKSAELNIGPAGLFQQEKEPGRGRQARPFTTLMVLTLAEELTSETIQ